MGFFGKQTSAVPNQLPIFEGWDLEKSFNLRPSRRRILSDK